MPKSPIPPTPMAKAAPAIYPKLRSRALEQRIPGMPDGVVHCVLMDWHVNAGTATVLAAAEGTASIYLSSGGGFIGGGQSDPRIREAALRAVSAAQKVIEALPSAPTRDLPAPSQVAFWIITNSGLRSVSVLESQLKSGGSVFAELGSTMQGVITAYRNGQPGPASPKAPDPARPC